MSIKIVTGVLWSVIISLLTLKVNAQPITKTINSQTGFLEVRNGLCGIVIPWKEASTRKVFDLAPIQSFIYKDGNYSDTSINTLKTVVKPYLFTANILSETPSALTLKLDYRFKKPKFDFYGATYKGGEAGPGYYTVLITLRQGRKSITIDEETNYDIDYQVGINQGLHADKARYRGYSSDSKANGYEPDGKIYRAEHDRGYGMDAAVDLDFSTLKYTYWWPAWEVAGGEVNTGRYWQFFNSRDKLSSNMFGYFQGKPSIIHGGTAVGPRVKSNTENNAENIELIVSMERRGPDNSWFPRKRVQWNAFISTREDILSAEKPQPIGIEMNFISGLASRIKQYASASNRLIPAFYDGAIYLDKNNIQSLLSRVKKDKSFYNYLVSIDDGMGIPIWDSWQDSMKARKNIEELIAFKSYLINEYINGDGSFSLNLRYWKGVRTFRGKAFLISCLFADKSIKITLSEKKELESLIGIMARILNDNDNVPIQDSVGVNLGNANMVHQYVQGGRNFFTLLLANDPEFANRARTIVSDTKKEIENFFYANGSTFGTPHYIQPAVDPLLFLMLQIRQAGLGDLFTTAKIKSFARFYTSLLSPPSVRFKHYRKLISLGDGSEESASTFGLLAAGIKPSDEALSKELYAIFFNGPARGSFAGPAALAVDLTAVPRSSISLTSSSYGGYQSNIRLAINSTIESAIWAINGNKYFDHRNDDAGELVIYALGAPLSLSRSSFYYPRADAAHIRTMVIPEDKFPEWDGKDQPINGRSYTWNKTELLEYAPFKDFTSFRIVSSTDSVSWFRQVIAIQAPDSTPIIIIKDSVTNNKRNIWSMNMLSDGPIVSSSGDLNPIKKQYFNGTSTELPMGIPAILMPAKWNYFKFQGQNWPLHETSGIDWDLYTFTRFPLKASAAYWATNWQNSIEQSEFLQSNKIPYEEAQQILRINHKGLITAVLLPRLKNKIANQVIPDQNNSNILIKNASWTLQILPSGFAMTDQSSRTKVTGLFFSGASLSTDQFSISGGPQEVIVQDNIITVQVSGNAGERVIEWPHKVINLGKPVNISLNTSSSTIRINQASNTNNVANGSIGYQQYQFKSL